MAFRVYLTPEKLKFMSPCYDSFFVRHLKNVGSLRSSKEILQV